MYDKDGADILPVHLGQAMVADSSAPWGTTADLFAMAGATKGTRIRREHITIYFI